MARTREEQLAADRLRYKTNKYNFYKNKFCVRCFSLEELELDHIDPTQKEDHRIWAWSKEKRNKEIEKCQVLCHKCHVKKSWEEQGRKRAECGSHSMYTKGCRCEPCRVAHRLHNRKYS